MKRASRRPARHSATPLSSTLNYRLDRYALAAGAAGLGLLALSTPVLAEVVFTPANVTLTNGLLSIDLNHDGINDFTFSDALNGICCRRLDINPSFRGSSQNGVEGIYQFAAALRAGEPIGSGQLFLHGDQRMASAADSNSRFSVQGPFANKTNRFLGLEFIIKGEKHYGWARFSMVRAGFNGGAPVISATLTGYAYETVANKAILAGKTSDDAAELNSIPGSTAQLRPASLGLLAIGSLGFSEWRKE
jgi:hypothetical protein